MTVVEEVRSGLIWSRRTLWKACWSPSWDAAEPRVRAVQEELVAALGVLALAGMPDDYDDALQDISLWDALVEALSLVTQAVNAAADAPTMCSRALLSEAFQQMDRVAL